MEYGGFAPITETQSERLCPLYGGKCVGPDKCAPAAMYASAANSSLPSSNAFQRFVAACPIVLLMESALVTMHALLPILVGTDAQEERSEADIIRSQINQLKDQQ